MNTPRREIPRRESRLIETEAIIIAYAMSRLDKTFLLRFGYKSWRVAFTATGDALGVPATSMKHLRDEFDPIHGHRKGWHKRPLRSNRQRVLGQFIDIGDDALLEIVSGLLRGDSETSSEVAAPLAYSARRVENVAQRLRTGRLAEEFFMSNSLNICGIGESELIDRRMEAAGYDFGVVGRPELAIEIKGLSKAKGDIMFTDYEWRTARIRTSSLWLVVVGDISGSPRARLWRDPAAELQVKSRPVRSISVAWRAAVAVA